MSSPSACSECLARSWLLGRLAGHLDVARGRVVALLDLGDEDLIAAVAGADEGSVRSDREAFDADASRARCAAAGVELVCRCDPAYPPALWSLPAEPAVLHVAGEMARFRELAGTDAVAIVGARTASPYGLDIARSLGRGLGSAGLTVVSGMAMGIDAAAHQGALDAGAGTIAVLPSAPERSYPASGRTLHRRILATGSAVSELGPGVAVRRWMFPARNRIIAALSRMTVVVAARCGSGAMLTAGHATALGRELGAVPGPVTAPLSWGPHQLLRGGAHLVVEPQDVLLALFGADAPRAAAVERRVPERLRPLLEAIADGHDLPQAFQEAGLGAEQGLTALAELEMAGEIRRRPGGRFSIVP